MRRLLLGLVLLAGCESEADRAQRAEQEAALERLEQLGHEQQARAAMEAPPPAVDSMAMVPPCQRPRPYRDWSNEEVSLTLLESMDWDVDDPRRAMIMAEAACRQ